MLEVGETWKVVRGVLLGNNTASYVDALVLTEQAAATRKGGRGGAGGQFRREGGPADVFGARDATADRFRFHDWGSD